MLFRICKSAFHSSPLEKLDLGVRDYPIRIGSSAFASSDLASQQIANLARGGHAD